MNEIERAEACADKLSRIDCTHKDASEGATIIRDLLAVVKRLDRTADGVPITPGMNLYPSFCPEKHETAGPVHTRYEYDVLYSTSAAAEQARTKQGEGRE